ncbi:hypothetical protein [Gordonia humi]|uniref:Uncharacterized protein n=1 Tax=Gordonia humi TaxID=686429 RepID=A0A840ESI1_9ACTN|nr:hypothetical protein [Gordonia humi]
MTRYLAVTPVTIGQVRIRTRYGICVLDIADAYRLSDLLTDAADEHAEVWNTHPERRSL